MPDNYDPNNIFARILRGELPCVRVFEDEHTLAFMDAMPQVDGHVLVVPKEAAATLFELSPQALAAVMRTTQRVARAVRTGMAAPGVMLAQLNGSAAGQTVPHFHFHVIPRHGGEVMRPHAVKPEAPEKLQAFATRIIAALD